MPVPDQSSSPPVSHGRGDFFRHSGWMMVAGILGGVFAWGVHFLAKKMPPSEYGLFGALMAVTLCVPLAPLQMAFTHQTASAVDDARRRRLSGLVRVFCGGAFLLWLGFVILVVVLHKEIFYRWEVHNASAFWIMLPFLLLTMLTPVFTGLLQGKQNFLWLGWASLISLGVRLLVAVLAVLVVGAGAAGLMTGVLVGGAASLGIALWQSREIWRQPAEHSNWQDVLRETLPLMIGFGAFQFFFSADTMFAKAYFGADEAGFYTGAGTLARALMWVVGPLALVMFPKLVHSHARSEKSDLPMLVFVGTAILSVVGAVGLSLVGPWVVQFVFTEQYVKLASTLLPWYAAAMVPLTLANVLLNDLFARNRHGVVPALVVLALLYVVAMTQFHRTMVQLLQAFGVANLTLLAVCLFFRMRGDSSNPTGEKPQT